MENKSAEDWFNEGVDLYYKGLLQEALQAF